MPIRTSKPKRRLVSPIVYMLIPLAFFLGLGGGYLLWGFNQPSESVADNSNQRVEISTDGEPSIGPDDAPVTIIEFADYQCGYCREWYDQVFDQLLANYPTQVRFVFRDYAFLTANSLPAAEAAECANEQNVFWKYQKALFSQQYEFGRSSYIQYASDLGLDVQAFTTCIDSERYKTEVQTDTRDGSRAGVNGTPAFFVNGKFIPPSYTFEEFRAYVDEALAAAQ